MWKWVGKEGFEPLPGIEPRDYADGEFELLSERYDEGFPGHTGALKRSGLWKHLKDGRPGAVEEEGD